MSSPPLPPLSTLSLTTTTSTTTLTPLQQRTLQSLITPHIPTQIHETPFTMLLTQLVQNYAEMGEEGFAKMEGIGWRVGVGVAER